MECPEHLLPWNLYNGFKKEELTYLGSLKFHTNTYFYFKRHHLFFETHDGYQGGIMNTLGMQNIINHTTNLTLPEDAINYWKQLLALIQNSSKGAYNICECGALKACGFDKSHEGHSDWCKFGLNNA